jgi:hypothetical protein
MTPENRDQNSSDQPTRSRQEPYLPQLGAVPRDYIDELATLGKKELRKKLKLASDAMIDRILSSGHKSISSEIVREVFESRLARNSGATTPTNPQLATTRATSTIGDALQFWKGAWYGVEYSLSLSDPSGGVSKIRLKRALTTDEEVSYTGEIVLVYLPNSEILEVQLWPDGESIPDQTPEYDPSIFEGTDFIEIGLLNDVIFALGRVRPT